ncbi:hypothetical protein [Nocardioides nematodiphilus]|uniref:hypothetical protein n=1 Tax=Nocardioides nematodiphilus TaxID=2849669 RepID=UPI001CD97142|nr:hypothetical protein [Nocardioides nematodiphilus]MCA1983626.1 hypothetical protein [Nocardioides nematodiphilus]
MTMKTRRLLAATLTSALVAAPALVCSGPAQASTAAPSGLISGVVQTVTGTLPLPAPLNTLVNTIVTAVDSTVPTGGTGGTGTGSTDPATIVTSLVNGLAGALTSGDPTQVLTGLQDQLAGFGFAESDITDVLGSLNPSDLDAISAGLLDLVPLDQLFGGAIPDPVAALLGQTSTPHPTDTGELIDAMTEFYKNQNMTEEQIRKDAAAKTLPKSALDALLLALKKPATAPKPPATGPSAACTSATKKVTKLKKQLKLAKRMHLRGKAKRLSKKLTRAKMAKIRAC